MVTLLWQSLLLLCTHVVLNFGPHAGRNHVRRERGRGVLAALLLGDQPHGQRELLGVQFPLLFNIAQVPAMVWLLALLRNE